MNLHEQICFKPSRFTHNGQIVKMDQILLLIKHTDNVPVFKVRK